jgi:predicted lipoprotein with Yx(FWY)xxD motif
MRPSTRLLSLAAAATILLIASACSSAGSSPGQSVLDVQTTATTGSANSLTLGMTADSSLGSYLTGQNRLTLYIFTADSPDMSSCTTSQCLANWSPLTVSGGETVTPPTGAMGTFATITRSDGGQQVTYNHQPLYYYMGDATAGDTNGQGANNKWYVAPLNGTYSPGASSSSAASATASTPGGY